MSILPAKTIVSTTIACSFVLLGNAITQSFMGVPALLVDFPDPASPDHAARARLLGRQWPVFWKVGNSFFRPISTFGIFGYAYTAWAANLSGARLGDWRFYAVAATCHFFTVVHSAINMQPLNNKLDGLKDSKAREADVTQADSYARTWIKFNTVRLIMPFVAGSVALWQTVKSI